MKTRSLILIVFFVVGISILSALAIQNPPKTSVGIDVFYPESQRIVSDPVCFVTTATGEKSSAVLEEKCYPLSDLASLGCDKPLLEHLYKYSNLFDKEFDGNYVIATIGLPEGMTWEKLQECVDVILEKRLPVFVVAKDNESFDVSYAIKGGIVKDMVFSNSTNSLLVKIDSTDKGNLTLNIPRNLLDAKFDYCPPHQANPPDDKFFVLLDGEEIAYDETATTESRTLQIPFLENSAKIEVIGTCLI